jgi:hypothetical protein
MVVELVEVANSTQCGKRACALVPGSEEANDLAQVLIIDATIQCAWVTSRHRGVSGR